MDLAQLLIRWGKMTKNGGNMMNENLGQIKWWELTHHFFVTLYEFLMLIFYIGISAIVLLARKALLDVRR